MTVYGLTRIQSEGYEFIRTFIARKNFSPSYREIANALGMASVDSASKLVRAIAERGLITFRSQSRSIALVERREEDVLSFLPGEVRDQLNACAVLHKVSPYDIIAESLRDALPRYLPIHRRPDPLAASTSRPPTSPELAGSSIR